MVIVESGAAVDISGRVAGRGCASEVSAETRVYSV
jgi:hypothetical protein